MPITTYLNVSIEHHNIYSSFLKRDVKIDCYLPLAVDISEEISLLLINDGQDLVTMKFGEILKILYTQKAIVPLFCIGIHCSADRKNEYGTAGVLDYGGRGNKAGLYARFILEELMPYIRKNFTHSFKDKSYAGFSLGGLSAMDIVWNHSKEFKTAGIFSGSFWWRDKDQHDPGFDEDLHRIMHRLVREGTYKPWLKFFFEVGTQDETADRNNNGIIDAIDDTVGLIRELQLKGYKSDAIKYVELQDGRHDVATWANAFPAYLKWGFGQNYVE